MSKKTTHSSNGATRRLTRDVVTSNDQQDTLSEQHIDHVVAHLNQAEQQLDDVTTTRLAAIRHQTLAHSASQSEALSLNGWLRWFLPTDRLARSFARSRARSRATSLVGSLAALAAVAVLVNTLWTDNNNRLMSPEVLTGNSDSILADFPASNATDTDISILFASDDLDFFQSLEFIESLDDDDFS